MTTAAQLKPEPITLLCVDDEPTGLKIRKMLLERCGYRVLIAESGQGGLDLLKTNVVDAVILDYFMPGMNGGEVARTIKRTWPALPVVMLSAYVNLPEGATDACDAVFTKGDPPNRLLDTIQELTSGRAA